MVSGHQERPSRASLATTTTSRPSTRPMPVITPAAGPALVLIVRDQQPDLEPGGTGIKEELHPLTGGELSLLVHLRDARGAATGLEPVASARYSSVRCGAGTDGPLLGQSQGVCKGEWER